MPPGPEAVWRPGPASGSGEGATPLTTHTSSNGTATSMTEHVASWRVRTRVATPSQTGLQADLSRNPGKSARRHLSDSRDLMRTNRPLKYDAPGTYSIDNYLKLIHRRQPSLPTSILVHIATWMPGGLYLGLISLIMHSVFNIDSGFVMGLASWPSRAPER
jgi:hypothetical protein